MVLLYTPWARVVLVVEQCKQNIYTYLFIYFSKINPFVKGIFVCIPTFFYIFFLIFYWWYNLSLQHILTHCCVIRILQLLVFTNSAKTIAISPCCCESTWNGSNKTGTAGLRPLRRKKKCQDRLRANERGGRSDGTKRKEIKAEQEEANVVETGRSKEAWQWWNRDVKESKMTALREILCKKTWEYNIAITCPLVRFTSLLSAAAGRDARRRCERVRRNLCVPSHHFDGCQSLLTL